MIAKYIHVAKTISACISLLYLELKSFNEPLILCIGLSLTKANVQVVLQKSQVYQCKGWPKTLSYFSLPTIDVEGDLSLTQKTQYLSESWLDTEEDCDWWKLGMKLIRCCKRREIKAIHELMKKVANYNHSGELSKSSNTSVSEAIKGLRAIADEGTETPQNVISIVCAQHHCYNTKCTFHRCTISGEVPFACIAATASLFASIHNAQTN